MATEIDIKDFLKEYSACVNESANTHKQLTYMLLDYYIDNNKSDPVVDEVVKIFRINEKLLMMERQLRNIERTQLQQKLLEQEEQLSKLQKSQE